ncbi:MAG: hypothetical protein HY690_03600 [Chloroflexi bacterium]|nr:hypothetical protein [Chloroflexota bacterium]
MAHTPATPTRLGLALAAAAASVILAGGVTLASVLGYIAPNAGQPSPAPPDAATRASAALPGAEADARAPGDEAGSRTQPAPTPSPSAPPAPRVVLVPILPEGQAASARPGPGESPGSLLAPAAQEANPPAVPAPHSAPEPAPQAAPTPAQPLFHVDENGNTWAWYGRGDWVLVQPAPAPASPPDAAPLARPRAQERERRDDEREHERREQGQRGGEERARQPRVAPALAPALALAPAPQVATRHVEGERGEAQDRRERASAERRSGTKQSSDVAWLARSRHGDDDGD